MKMLVAAAIRIERALLDNGNACNIIYYSIYSNR